MLPLNIYIVLPRYCVKKKSRQRKPTGAKLLTNIDTARAPRGIIKEKKKPRQRKPRGDSFNTNKVAARAPPTPLCSQGFFALIRMPVAKSTSIKRIMGASSHASSLCPAFFFAETLEISNSIKPHIRSSAPSSW